MADNIKFHETFQPELTYISRILELAIEGYEGDKYHISDTTGIPTGKEKGKVEPHIKYASYMGLIDYGCNRGVYRLRSTTLGDMVWNQDRYLHEELTIWMLHYCITRRNIGAPQWSYLIHKINDGFNTEISTNHISSLVQKDFTVSSIDAAKAISVLRSSYINGAFANIQYLDWEDKLKFREKTEDLQYQYLYAYALLNSWDFFFPDKKEITLSDITDILDLGKVFGLNDEELDSVLSTLEEDEIVTINRQLFPITIIRTFTTIDALDRLYSKLM